MFITTFTSPTILSQINPLYASHPTYCISCFILSTHLRLGPQSDLLPLGFPHQIPKHTSLLLYTCYVIHPSHLFWLDHPNNIWWGLQILTQATSLASSIQTSWFQTLIPSWMSYSLGDNPASEFYVPTFRNTLFRIRRSCKQKRISSQLFLFTRTMKMEQCSETSAHKIQKPGKHSFPHPKKKNTTRDIFGRFWKGWSWSPDLQNEDHLLSSN